MICLTCRRRGAKKQKKDEKDWHDFKSSFDANPCIVLQRHVYNTKSSLSHPRLAPKTPSLIGGWGGVQCKWTT